MERPLCPLCKTKHFAREAHAFGKICAEPVVRTVPKQPKGGDCHRPTGEALDSDEGTNAVTGDAHPTNTPASESKFDRSAYQREYMRSYMRKWRAK